MKSSGLHDWFLAAAMLTGCGGLPPASSAPDSAPAADDAGREAPVGPRIEAGAGDSDADAGAAADHDGDQDAFDDPSDATDLVDAADALDVGDAADAAPTAACQRVGDCRVYSSGCGGCTCLSLGVSDPDPACNGPVVECLVDPCQGHTPACNDGRCAFD